MRNFKNQMIMLGFLVTSVTVIGITYASQSGPHEYNEWKNQPSEQFSDAESNFKKVKQLLLDQYHATNLTEEKLYQAATDGMLRALNENDKEAWNKLITPTELKELQNDIKGEIAGIGVEIKFDSETGISSVIGLIPNSAAEKSGVKVGDQIISVNGKLYKGLQFRDVVYEIRGKIGEMVRLKLLRGESIVTKEVTRERIAWSPVDAVLLDKKVGMVSIRHFNEKTPSLLRQSLEHLKKEGIKSLIIDLRGNWGGLFEKAVESAGFLLPKDSIIARVNLRGGKEEIVKASTDPIIQDVPISVLIDEATSSGAELFAASLSENLGAKLVGMKTHGKWNAQTVENLPNHFAVKFTTKLFKSPKNKSYQNTGVEPDIKVAGEEGWRPHPSKDSQKMLASDTILRAAYNLLSAF